MLSSNDGGYSFLPSNRGFSARQITSYVADSAQPARIYIGLVNDKAWGGVFVSNNGGLTWSQRSAGLNGQDVFAMGQASDGTVLAGTGHGLYRLEGEVWSPVNNVSVGDSPHHEPAVERKPSDATKTIEKSRNAAPKKAPSVPVRAFDADVNGITRSGDTLYAATSAGMLRSVTAGQSWKVVLGPEREEWNFVAAAKSWVIAATLRSAMLSPNGWRTEVGSGATAGDTGTGCCRGGGQYWRALGGGAGGRLCLGGPRSHLAELKDLAVRDVNSLFYDEASQRILITANNKNTIAFAVHVPDHTLQYWNSGWGLRLVRPVGDHLVGATLFDGIVVQPRMVDSSEVAKH